MKKFSIFFLAVCLCISITGCSKETPSFSAQELVLLYSEKPEEAKKLENKEIILSGRVIRKYTNSDKKKSIAVWQEKTDDNRLVLYSFVLPEAEESFFKNVKIGDVIEGQGVLEPISLHEVNDARRINVKKMTDKPTSKKEHPQFKTYGAKEFYDLYKSSPETATRFEKTIIKISGEVLHKEQFANSPRFYVIIFQNGRWSNLLLDVPTSEKEKLNKLNKGDFIECYAYVVGKVPQDDGRESIQLFVQEIL